MMEIAPIAAASPVAASVEQPQISSAPAVPASFESLLTGGFAATDAKIARADMLVRQFAVDETVPVHQVTIALEEARMAVELAMQVRTRLVEGYRELMNMQL
ncbi:MULTISPECIES: flagellar hook-basal body complex protein FliE [unclassified Sphingopyxis]|uniref:flagellar hook-basal body complex protein FliE n=1 Tax=unclassified Sphingopyxis TaxID=2614943 RepID=UPI0009E7004F|nr:MULTISPECIES: flagellar hook-basal body complex protein FliE [unclassified Sphingopyxis]